MILTVLTSISGFMVIHHFLTVNSKVYLVQKTAYFLRSSSDLLDSNAKVIDELCEDPIAAHIRKKISLVSPTNGR